jgi:alpha-D-xyloside xylohydrolase
MDFNGDTAAVNRQYEFMFGKSLLVAPITEANTTELNVYLPKSSEWYDFWTGNSFNGGQTIKTNTSLDKIPLFVKAGSIIPMGKLIQYAGEKKSDTLEILVYKGADGKFDLYEDEGDNYNYEKGALSTIAFSWDNAKKTMTINDRKGSFPGMLAQRKIYIVLVDVNKGTGSDNNGKYDKEVTYFGKKVVVKL